MARPTFAPDHPVAPFGTALIDETVPAGGGLSVDNSILFLGRPSTKINIPVNLGSASFSVGTSSASFDLGAEAEQVLARTKVFAVRTDGQNTITSAVLQVGNAGLTVGYQFIRRNFYTETNDGWTIFVREPGHDGVAGSPDLTGNVRTRLTLTASANVKAGDIWVGFAGVLEAQPPTVVLTFDDGYAEWTWLASELASRGLPASFGISYGDIGKPGYLSSSEVQAIGNHVSGLFEITNHAEGNDSLGDLGLSGYIAEVEACRAYIEGLGLDPYAARLHAWVQGEFSLAAVDELKDLGYHSARAVETPGMVANHIGIALDGAASNALYAIPATAYLSSAHTVAQVQAQLELAKHGGTIFVVGHEFKASAGANGWINGYDSSYGILNLLDWLEDKRDNDGWQILRWSDWRKQIVPSAQETVEASAGAAMAFGHAAQIEQAVIIAAQVGAAAAVGRAATIESTVSITAAAGSAIAAGISAQVAQTQTIATGAGRAVAAGQPANVSETVTIDAQPGTSAARGIAAGVATTVTITASAGRAIAQGMTAVVASAQTVSASAAKAVGRGIVAAISQTVVIAAAAGRATATGAQATITQAQVVAAQVGRAVAVGMQAAVSTGGAIAARTGVAIARSLPATVAVRQALGAGVGSALARGRAATLGAGVALAAGTGAAVAAGLPAQIGSGGGIECNVGSAVARGSSAAIIAQQRVDASVGRALAAGLPATVGPADTSTGPYRATLAAFQRGAAITASTRGADIRRIA